MVAIPSRHRSLALLAGVLIAQLLMLAIQIKRDNRGRLIRVWAVAAVYPFEKIGSWGFEKVHGVWKHYVALGTASRENEALRVENDALKLTINELQSRAAEADRMAALLNFKQGQKNPAFLGARVIGASASDASHTLEIDRGERDGVRRNMGVITPDGAVGKVIEVYGGTSQVLLLTDKESGIGAMLLESRIQGPVGGMGEPTLNMKYVANDDKVNVGEKVVTSGTDKIFPRDVPVGVVTEIKPGNPFKVIRVKPTAKLDRLEEVLVLLTPEPLEFKSETPAQGAPAAQSAPATSGGAAPTVSGDAAAAPAQVPATKPATKPANDVPAANGATAKPASPAPEHP